MDLILRVWASIGYQKSIRQFLQELPSFIGDVMPQVKVSSLFNRLWDKLTELQRLMNGVLNFVPKNSGVLSIQARMRDDLEVEMLEALNEILECTIEPI